MAFSSDDRVRVRGLSDKICFMEVKNVFMLLSASTSLTTLGEVFTQVVQWVINFLGLISSEPLLLVGLAIVVVGIVAGLAFKMIRGRGRKGG